MRRRGNVGEGKEKTMKKEQDDNKKNMQCLCGADKERRERVMGRVRDIYHLGQTHL